MKTSQQGKELIMYFEGFSDKPYQDQAGHWTIGYGHLIKGGEKFGQLLKVDAEALLDKDLEVAEESITVLSLVDLKQCQFDALVSFVYNLGEEKVTNSTLIQKLNDEDFQGAADEFLKWNKVTINGVKKIDNGLDKRRHFERELFLTGEIHEL